MKMCRSRNKSTHQVEIMQTSHSKQNTGFLSEITTCQDNEPWYVNIRVGVIVIDCNQIIVIAISRCNVIVIDYIVNVIVINDYFHDYTRLFTILYQTRDMVWYVKQKLTLELIYPLTDCCYIYIHMMICQFIYSMNMKGQCVETASNVAPIISHINRYFILTRVVSHG